MTDLVSQYIKKGLHSLYYAFYVIIEGIFKVSQYAYLQPIITQYFIDNKSEIWLLFLIAHSKR